VAFASSSDLATRLGRSFTEPEASQAAALLDDATAYLQAELGGQLIEAGSTVVTLYADGDRLRLPQWPIRAVTSVTRAGNAVTGYEINGGFLILDSGWGDDPLVVTYDYGATTVPAELVSWCCVLAAGALAQVTRSGALSASGVASERIDDYAVTYAGGEMAFALPDRVLGRLKAQYGAGAHVSGAAL
jgi:hypothetical protein